MSLRPSNLGIRLASIAAASLWAFGHPVHADIYSFGDTELLAFADSAVGDTPPERILTSSTAALNFKSGLALDLVHRELFIGTNGEVLVFDSREAGDTAPLRAIGGASTGVGDVAAVAVDLVDDLLYVASWSDDAILVFHRTDDGNVTPLRRLVGPLSTIDGPEGVLVDHVHGELVVSISDNAAGNRAIAFYALSALQGSGTIDVAPLRRISGAATLLGDPRGLALDLDGDRIAVVDRNGAISFFPRTATGDVAPVQRIAGGNTQVGGGQEIQILDDGDLLVGIDGAPSSSLVFHDAAASGNANPARRIVGASTQLTYSIGVASSHARDCAWAKSVDGCLFRDNFDGGSLCDWSAATGGAPCP